MQQDDICSLRLTGCTCFAHKHKVLRLVSSFKPGHHPNGADAHCGADHGEVDSAPGEATDTPGTLLAGRPLGRHGHLHQPHAGLPLPSAALPEQPCGATANIPLRPFLPEGAVGRHTTIVVTVRHAMSPLCKVLYQMLL